MKTDLKILAIDPATACGWAHSCGAHGTWDLSIRKDESSGMRLIRFEGKLREVLDGVGIDVIAFEIPTVAQGKRANTDALKLIVKLQAVIERLCELNGCECVGYNLQTIKKHAGCHKKDELVAAAKKKWPDKEIDNDNESDALWLLDMAQLYLGVGDGNETTSSSLDGSAGRSD